MPAIHMPSVMGAIPIQDGITNPNQVVPKYYFGAPRGTTSLLIPSTYPKNLAGPVVEITQRLRLSDPTIGDELEFTFGWSPDGRFWVLFGLLPWSNPEDVRKMEEFPRMLRACAEGDTLVGGDSPSAKNQNEAAYLDMRRAYKLTTE